MKTSHALVLVAVVAGCSGPAASPPLSCPTGQSYNPITGTCVVGVAPPDAATAADDGPTSAPDVALPEADMRPTPDLGAPSPDLGSPPDMGPTTAPGIRFVAIGDTGTGSDTQRKVGASIGMICASLGGCDFGLLLGDNFYDTGVSSVDDSLWMTMFEIPYGDLGFPFYAVLGNHDLGGDGLGIDLDQNKATYQIQYGQQNPMWIMPSRFYDFTVGPVHFVALDTTAVFFGNDDDQRQAVPGMIANAGDRWKIAFGHHPYFSNGPHGNAGEYEGLPFIPIANGEHVRSFVEDHICGKVDVYICGHDHSRQDLVPDCQGTQFLVSGAGAKTTDLEGDNPTHFQSDLEGFLLVEATDRMMRWRFYDENGVQNHERTITR